MPRFLPAALLAAVVGLLPTFVNTAAAQTRGPAFRPKAATPPRPTPVPRPAPPVRTTPAAKPAVPPATGRVHGNSLSSNRANTQYGIYKVDKTGEVKPQLWKTGVSSARNVSGGTLPKPRAVVAPGRNYSTRALTQTRALNANAAETENGRYVYRTRNFATVNPQPAGGPTARSLITNRERNTVTTAAAKNNGVAPTGNVLPKPAPASTWPRKK